MMVNNIVYSSLPKNDYFAEDLRLYSYICLCICLCLYLYLYFCLYIYHHFSF
ncbi:hypothetical protein [Albatrosspox virus]|nr:hypothetical protein [Penguinpox virus 2]QRM16187.1 hypothetical protein [Albatrosspox virus]